MSLSKLENQIREIAKFYFVALRNINYNCFSSGDEDVYSPFYKYYQDVEQAFSRLSKEHRKIINNEYFHEAYSNWWVKEYRLSSFNKLKKIAIKDFLEAFYEIH